MSDESVTPPRRRRGNPNMRKGAPSLNPFGRPPVSRALSAMVRAKVPPQMFIAHALRLIESPDTPPAVRLRALEMLERRGYGRPSEPETTEPAQSEAA